MRRRRRRKSIFNTGGVLVLNNPPCRVAKPALVGQRRAARHVRVLVPWV